MTRIRAIVGGGLAALALLSGCASAVGGVGSPPEPPGPTYHYLEASDYEYTLEISCFCPNSGVPIRITVEHGSGVRGVYLATTRDGAVAGELSPEYTWITLNDVIGAANDHSAEQVYVSWPSGQQWPDSVGVDPELNTLDEEYGYRVYDVDLG